MKKQKKVIIQSVFIFIILLIILLAIFPKQKSSSEICFNNSCFFVEIADTNEERATGLMFRKSMDNNSGMLFIFDKADNYSFWMKNTQISLDIIWINENKEIVFIKNNVIPCNETCIPINPDKKAKYVLEINAGISEEISLKESDKARFKNMK